MKKRFLSFAFVCLTLAALTSVAFSSSSKMLYCDICRRYVPCTFSSESSTPATCTQSGADWYFDYANHKLYNTVPALGHDWEELERIEDPTCAAFGSADMACSRCEVTEIQSIPALGHAYVVTSHTDPTCIVSGSIVTTCSRCDDMETQSISALGHDYAVNSHTDPTCTDAGSTVTVCSRCDDMETESILALGHDYVETSRTEASTSPGSIEYTCFNCGDVKHETIPAVSPGTAAGFDGLMTGFEYVVFLFWQVWELLLGNPLLTLFLAVSLVVMGVRAFRRLKSVR